MTPILRPARLFLCWISLLFLSSPAAVAGGPALEDGMDTLFVDWSLAFGQDMEKTYREVFLRKYESLAGILDRLKGEERSEGLKMAVELSSQCEMPEEAEKWSKIFLKEFPKHRSAAKIKGMLARSSGQTGKSPPAFNLPDIDGRPRSPSAYRGKILLIDFWATWCGPCVGEIPHVRAAYEKYHAQGLEILGVSLDHDTGTLRNFIQKENMPWPQIFDGPAGWEEGLAAAYGVHGIPSTVLVDRRGRIAATEVRGEELDRAIESLIAGKKLPAVEMQVSSQPAARPQESKSPRRMTAWEEKAEEACRQMEKMIARIKDFVEVLHRYPVDGEDWRLRAGPIPTSPWGTEFQYLKTPDHRSFTLYCNDDRGRLAVDYYHNDHGLGEGFHIHRPPTRGRVGRVKENMFWNESYLQNPLGHLAADSLRELAGADIALVNALALRGNLAAGAVTQEDIARVSPWPGGHVVVEMSGMDLLDALQKSLEPRWFMFASGLTGVFGFGGSGLAGEFFVKGEALAPGKIYRVAISQYLYEGGDQHPAFRGKNIVRSLPMATAEILKKYLSKHTPYIPDRRPRFRGHFRSDVSKMGDMHLERVQH